MSEVARLLLAAVLAVAGAAKLLDRDGTRRSATDFGLPAGLAAPVALGLPAVELVLAAGLVASTTARLAAAAATLLLLSFTGLVAVKLLQGERPACRCFGRLHTARIGLATLVRNGVLAAAALTVAVRPAARPTGWEIAAAIVGLIIGAQALLSWTLLRRLGQALRRIDELEAVVDDEETLDIGSDAPSFSLPAVGGSTLSLEELVDSGKPLLLVFTDTGCGACTALLPDLVRWQHDHAERLTLAVVGHGDEERLRAAAEEHGLERLLLAPDRALARAYGARGTPSAVLVADGRLATPVVYGADEISSLLGAGGAEPPAEAVAYA